MPLAVGLQHRPADVHQVVVDLLEVDELLRGERLGVPVDRPDVLVSGDRPEAAVGRRLGIPVHRVLPAQRVELAPAVVALEAVVVGEVDFVELHRVSPSRSEKSFGPKRYEPSAGRCKVPLGSPHGSVHGVAGAQRAGSAAAGARRTGRGPGRRGRAGRGADAGRRADDARRPSRAEGRRGPAQRADDRDAEHRRRPQGRGAAAGRLPGRPVRRAGAAVLAGGRDRAVLVSPRRPGLRRPAPACPDRQLAGHAQTVACRAKVSGSLCSGITHIRWPPGTRRIRHSSHRSTSTAPRASSRAVSASTSSVSMSTW